LKWPFISPNRSRMVSPRTPDRFDLLTRPGSISDVLGGIHCIGTHGPPCRYATYFKSPAARPSSPSFHRTSLSHISYGWPSTLWTPLTKWRTLPSSSHPGIFVVAPQYLRRAEHQSTNREVTARTRRLLPTYGPIASKQTWTIPRSVLVIVAERTDVRTRAYQQMEIVGFTLPVYRRAAPGPGPRMQRAT
jgi:hypothetical protein